MSPVSTGTSTPRPAAVPGFTWIVAAAIVVLGTDLGMRVLVNNDEARFAVLAQDILARGDWLYPRAGGSVYLNKPILLAWLIALVSWPVGHVTQLTAVIPSAAAALATVAIVYAMGHELAGTIGAQLAALVAMTTQGLFMHARVALPDMLMTCFMAASVWMLVKLRRSPERPYWLAFYAFTALAFWAKGPAGLMPLAVALAYHLASRRALPVRALHLLPGLALVAAMVGLWAVLGSRASTAGVRHAVVVDQVLWYLPGIPSLGVVTGPLRNAFGILFPWVLLAPMVVTHAVRFVRGRGAEREIVLLMLVWCAVTLVGVGLSQQQRLRYYLPLVPPVSVLVAGWLAGPVARTERAAIPWRLYGVIVGVPMAATIAAAIVRPRWQREAQIYVRASWVEIVVMVGVALATLLAFLVVFRTRRTDAALAAALGTAICLIVGYHWELARLNREFDYPQLYAHVKPVVDPAPVVATWGVPDLALTFYFRRPVVAVETDQALRELIGGDPRAVAILTDRALDGSAERTHLTAVAQDRVGFHTVSLARYAAR